MFIPEPRIPPSQAANTRATTTSQAPAPDQPDMAENILREVLGALGGGRD
jgi:hypothetical protein